MRREPELPWHVHAADGELLAMLRYCIDAARMASIQGKGTTVHHGGHLMLTVAEKSDRFEAADEAAKVLIEAAYGRA
jgi:hypothetical protein